MYFNLGYKYMYVESLFDLRHNWRKYMMLLKKA